MKTHETSFVGRTHIDVTPSWSATMDILILMLESGDDESKALAKQELRDLGKQLDEMKESEDA